MACGFVLEQSRNQHPDESSRRRRLGSQLSGNVSNLLCEPELGNGSHALGDFDSLRVVETYVMVATRQHDLEKIVAERQRRPHFGQYPR